MSVMHATSIKPTNKEKLLRQILLGERERNLNKLVFLVEGQNALLCYTTEANLQSEDAIGKSRPATCVGHLLVSNNHVTDQEYETYKCMRGPQHRGVRMRG